ncbi:hypothetical protein [Immundisolibacter sp.]|uniref:hypothetical protein n=1 Tax=Immundisolibacter sp. TaxID=1934948 RepID=UPI000ECAB84A|nr:hypothetical protein [Gammaproteobacteria bacterium]
MKAGPRYVLTTPRLGTLARRSVYVACLLLLLTGIAWLVLHTWVRVEGAFGPQHHPAEIWLMRLHGLLAVPTLTGLGALLARHVWPAWRPRQRRTSGLLVLIACALLALGGWGLYYAADETLRQWLSVSHWLMGLALPALLLGHVAGARRERRADERAARRQAGV